MTKKKVGEIIRKAREKKKIRPVDLARELGIRRTRLCAWEKGRAEVPGTFLIKLLCRLRVPVKDYSE